jgi:gluconolactonase
MKFMRLIRLSPALCLAAGLAAALLTARAQVTETYFSNLLVDGSGWEVAAEGYQFTDAACFDAGGNFYFTDAGRGTNVFRIAPDGQVSAYLGNAAGVSGLKFGPDGRLYACQGRQRRVIAFDHDGSVSVLATNVGPNDLVETAKGGIYFTDTGKKQVEFIDPQGGLCVVDQGITAPNGLTLSPDQQTLAVSDYGGRNVWTFRVEPDGSLSGKEPYMTMRAPEEGKSAGGDGMATDTAGRYYVCTALGLQVFDPTGRLCGVMPKPQAKGLTNVGFGGPKLEFLYITCGDKVYRRKTLAHGAVFFTR